MFTDGTPLTREDLSTILAGLRSLQEDLPTLSPGIQAIATDNGEIPLPTAERIDALCEMLNCGALPSLPGSTK